MRGTFFFCFTANDSVLRDESWERVADLWHNETDERRHLKGQNKKKKKDDERREGDAVRRRRVLRCFDDPRLEEQKKTSFFGGGGLFIFLFFSSSSHRKIVSMSAWETGSTFSVVVLNESQATEEKREGKERCKLGEDTHTWKKSNFFFQQKNSDEGGREGVGPARSSSTNG